MEGNPNKVYINPNFKRPVMSTQPFIEMNVSKLYEYFPHQLQNYLSIENKSNTRIYVNPNFKQKKQNEALKLKPPESYEENENINMYPKSFLRSRYSLVTNIKKRNVDERNVNTEERSQSNLSAIQGTDIMYNSNICTQKQEVPIIKSRYTIIRKKKVLSEVKGNKQVTSNKESKSKNLIESGLLGFPINSSLNKCLLENEEKKESHKKAIQNITKIKINKYKTVPITDLKRNFSLNEAKVFKTISSRVYQNLEKNKRVEISVYNSRYKLTRCNSRSVSSNIVNAPKTYITTKNKITRHNQSGTKLLKSNFKLNNIPCRLYTKYGKCLRKDYGNCKYLHDKKHLSLCRKFIKGICHDRNCLLSHELTANKMPTCFFYLKGICTKDNCPYLHVKLNEKTKICHDFIRGYCDQGDICKFRHVKINKGNKNLIFNSSNRIRNKITKTRKPKPSNNTQKKNLTTSGERQDTKPRTQEQTHEDCRYYREMVKNEESCKNIKPTRCKIGTLPSFIQL